jgi:hypothetical protein
MPFAMLVDIDPIVGINRQCVRFVRIEEAQYGISAAIMTSSVFFVLKEASKFRVAFKRLYSKRHR